jgi:biopolymer transport protein ExbD
VTDEKNFDVWFLSTNTAMKRVPYHVVADWLVQGKVLTTDKIRPSGSESWQLVSQIPELMVYLSPPETKVSDMAESLAPIEMDFSPKSSEEEDDDVDMIPLIDISLVLLIFFMMTAAIASVSRIAVPDTSNGATVESDPGIIRIDIDWKDGRAIYALGLGSQNPLPEDDNLSTDVELYTRMDERLAKVTVPPSARIAGHGELPYEIVEEVMKSLDRRVKRGQLADYSIEVNDRGR